MRGGDSLSLDRATPEWGMNPHPVPRSRYSIEQRVVCRKLTSVSDATVIGGIVGEQWCKSEGTPGSVALRERR